MRIVVAAVGRLKDGPERALLSRYVDRTAAAGRSVALGPVEVREIPESRAATPELRQRDEAERLLGKVRDCPLRVALDVRGKGLSSLDFARWLRDFRDAGEPTIAFLIGGPDGHGDEVRAGARRSISLGSMTLPHGLARIVLAEQIYRAATISSGHPYHRE